jgi:hypothetical protein
MARVTVSRDRGEAACAKRPRSKKEPRRSGAEVKEFEDETRAKLHSVTAFVGPVADKTYGALGR